MNSIDQLLGPYAELEDAIRELMISIFSKDCGLCTACCCRADVCEEALQSAFLKKLLQRQNIKESEMDDRYGWLDVNGCILKYGRPPVCYSFYCKEVLQKFHDDEAREAALILGRLIYHIGQNALGGWHLVEIMNEVDLDRVDFEGIVKRMREAGAALNVIKQYMMSGRFSKSDRDILSLITTEEP